MLADIRGFTLATINQCLIATSIMENFFIVCNSLPNVCVWIREMHGEDYESAASDINSESYIFPCSSSRLSYS